MHVIQGYAHTELGEGQRYALLPTTPTRVDGTLLPAWEVHTLSPAGWWVRCVGTVEGAIEDGYLACPWSGPYNRGPRRALDSLYYTPQAAARALIGAICSHAEEEVNDAAITDRWRDELLDSPNLGDVLGH